MTYDEINNIILEEFGKIPIVNSVTNNSLDWNTHKNTKYPAVAADLQNVTVNDGTATYNYYFTAAMIGVESEGDRVRNYTAMMETLYQGLENIMENYDIEAGSMTFNFASIKYMDVLDCCTCQLGLSTSIETDCELQGDLDN